MNISSFGTIIAGRAIRRATDRPNARGKRVEDRIEHVDGWVVPANHEAIAALKTPDSAGGADIDIMDAVLRTFFRSPDVVLEEGVAAVDHDVAGPGDGAQRRHGFLGRGSRRQHQPED